MNTSNMIPIGWAIVAPDGKTKLKTGGHYTSPTSKIYTTEGIAKSVLKKKIETIQGYINFHVENIKKYPSDHKVSSNSLVMLRAQLIDLTQMKIVELYFDPLIFEVY